MEHTKPLEEIDFWNHPPLPGSSWTRRGTRSFSRRIRRTLLSTPLQADSTRDDAEAKKDCWSITGNFIYRHHVEARVKLYMPREESFPIPLKYIDVTRNTHTSLAVMLEKHIDDYWNVDGERELSDAWTGFTRFILLNEGPLDGYTWSGGRLKRKRTTSRPDNAWPEMWKHMSDAAISKAKQKRAIEEPKLENAKHLRGIFFIKPNDEEFKHTMENARRKFEIPIPAAMLCKTPVNCRGETCRNIWENKTKYACIVDADESLRIRLEGVPHRYHEDHIAAKGINSLSHCNLVHKFIPMSQAFLKYPMWRMKSKKNGQNWKNTGMAADKSQKQKEVIEKEMNKGRKVHFASLMDLCHLKNSE